MEKLNDNIVKKILADSYYSHYHKIRKAFLSIDVKNYISTRFKNASFQEAAYRIMNEQYKTPECPICGKPVKWFIGKHDFLTYCSNKCRGKADDPKIKMILTNQKKYGSNFPAQNKDVYAKVKSTNKKKYGCENPMQNAEIKEKVKRTNLKKYGVSSTLLVLAVKEKIIKTLKEKYGCENPMQNDNVKEKVKRTNLKKYGCEWGLQNKEIQAKKESTNLKKYGCKCSLQNKLIRGKINLKMMELYGSIYPLQNAEIKEKVKQTNLKKYGCEWGLQNKEIQAKKESTNLKKYGCKCAFKNAEIHQKQLMSIKEKYGSIHPLQNKELLNKVFDTKKEHDTFNTSKPEEQAYEKLKEVFGEENVLRQYKSEFYPFACDFYIKNKDLYIELNFHWTHGGHPFNPLNENDCKKIEYWKIKNTKFYNNAIEVWSQKDPLKIKTAKENNINYKVFYSNEDFQNYIKNLNGKAK